MTLRRRWPAAGAARRRTVVAAAGLLLLVACGGGEPRGAPGAPAASGGTLRIPLINDPIFDPVIAPDLGSILPNKLLFPGLVRPDEQLQPIPDLAESWVISDDGLHATFKLRSGVQWHDGAPFSAEDVKFTFDAILDLASGSRLQSDFAAVKDVVVEDSLTVRFDFHAPFAPFLTLLGYNAGILPKHLLQGAPLTNAVAFNRRTPVGTGPFRLTEVKPGASVTLERNPHYYGSAPKLDRIVFKVVPDLNAQVAQLRAGELDLVTLEPANLASVQGVPGVEVLQVPVVQHVFVGLNVRRPHFRTAEVRRALGLAINRAAIIDNQILHLPQPDHGESLAHAIGIVRTMLTVIEGRILGCLFEKERTVPDQYPLTLNSLVSACNQSTFARPGDASRRVRGRGRPDLAGNAGAAAVRPSDAWARRDAVSAGGRRGVGLGSRCHGRRRRAAAPRPQTEAELRSRTERQHEFASLAEVDEGCCVRSKATAGCNCSSGTRVRRRPGGSNCSPTRPRSRTGPPRSRPPTYRAAWPTVLPASKPASPG